MRAPGLAFEISDAVHGYEERADGAVGIISAEIAVPPVKARDDTARLDLFEDVTAGGRIP